VICLPSESHPVSNSMGSPLTNPYAAVPAIPITNAMNRQQQMKSVHDLFITGPLASYSEGKSKR
jgi:hypothetical protein